MVVPPEPQSGSLFIYKAISSHFKYNQKTKNAYLNDFFNNAKIFQEHPLIKELWDLGYPVSSINSMLKCGLEIGKLKAKCSCCKKFIKIFYECNLRTCPTGAIKRKGRLKKELLPILKNLTKDSSHQIYFITISPENYDDLDYAYKHINESLSKFRRSNYVKDKIIWGLWVRETKNKNKFGECKGWNVHIHIIFYGKRLDNRIRGHCNDCKQNLLKYDKEGDFYYCANKKCNSKNVIIKNKDSKLVQIWKRCSKRDVHIYIPSQDKYKNNSFSEEKTLNYLLKYVSANKDDFKDIHSLALYIVKNRRKKLINTFGKEWKHYKRARKKEICICKNCNEEITYSFGDREDEVSNV